MPTSSNRFASIRSITEVAANLTLVVAVALGMTVWLRNQNTSTRMHNTSVPVAVSQYPTLGKQIALPGVAWSPHKATLVVAISSACHFCVTSTPFYSEITHSTHVAPIVVVMPQGEQDARAFLQQHAITPNSIVSASLASIQVNATPTLMLVSPSGTVKQMWVGELNDTQKNEVFTALDHL
jgi:hypothetical protein